MSKMMVINMTNVTQHVGVVHEDGRKDDIQIVPRKRVELRTGMVVDPAWLGRNPGCVRIVEPAAVSPSVPALPKAAQEPEVSEVETSETKEEDV